MESSKAKNIIRTHKLLESKNANWRSYHQDVADFCMPRKAWQNTMRQKGDRLNFNFLYDSVAIRSLKTAVAGFYSYFTNPASQWYGLEAVNQRLRENKDVQIYFKECEEVMNSVLDNYNFYPTAKEFYYDVIGLGTSAIFSESNQKEKAIFRCIPLHELTIEDDAYENTIAVYWSFKLTPMQAYMLWGNNCGKTVLEAKDNEEKAYSTDMEFLLYIGPRERRDFTKLDKLNMPFESLWISKKDCHIIDEGGFEEFPVHVGRFWKDPSDEFGYSPAMDALAEIKLRNASKKTALRRAMKETDPALDVPSKGYVLPLNLNPAAINYRDPKLAADNGIRALGVGSGNFSITEKMLEESRQEIEEHFFVPLFRAFSQITKQMTIPEVQERIREGMVLLGPAIGGFTNQTFKGLIIRLYSMLSRQGEFPDAPEILQGEEFYPVFVSPLARAQRESEIQSIKMYLSDISAIATFKPDVIDKVNSDATADIIAKIRGIDPRMINTDQNVSDVRKQREMIQQAQLQLDAMHKGAAIAKTGAEAESTAQEAQ